MTEAEWLACDDPRRLIHHLYFGYGIASRRKLGLSAAAFARLVWHLLDSAPMREAVEVAERFADGEVGEEAVQEASRQEQVVPRTRIRFAAFAPIYCGGGGAGASRALSAAEEALAAAAAMASPDPRSAALAAKAAARAEQVRIIQDIFGNPFSHAALAPAYRTAAAQALALAAYEEREQAIGHLDSARLAVLSDALEEAGCTDEAILTHLRSPGHHVRGCWALDLVLGKG